MSIANREWCGDDMKKNVNHGSKKIRNRVAGIAAAAVMVINSIPFTGFQEFCPVLSDVVSKITAFADEQSFSGNTHIPKVNPFNRDIFLL